jgi:hypothetical protein
MPPSCPHRFRTSQPIWRLAALSLFAFMTACSGGKSVPPRSMDDVLRSDFDRVSSARVYFGHQSVGGNIMSGLADLQGQLGQPVIRVGTLGSLDIPGDHGVLLHTKVGTNEQPGSKCEDFRRILDQQLAGRVDVALFKFCYIDFSDTSDIDAIFETYSRTMDDLKQRHPDIIFIHVTAPLRSVDRGLGIWAREMLGRPNRTKLANVRRNEFNRRLKERYPADPIYDLAAVMSTYPDGRQESFTMDGSTYYSLVPAYTDDGGHLNAVGRTHAAAEFVRSIAGALRASDSSRVATAP